MKLSQLVKEIERVVPKEWALDGDPIGLQIGDRSQDVERVYVTLELNSQRLKKVIQKRCGLVLAHHPLIFRPLKSLLESDPVQRIARGLVKHDIAFYGMHTNFDLHPQGMAGLWAKKLGCAEAQPIAPKPQANQLKIVTFVTAEHTHMVREALSKAGAGIIGEYDLCSYTLQGKGSFRGSDKSNPLFGQAGRFELEAEDRLEMVLPKRKLSAVVDALWKVHPYDEPAYDVYPLQDVRGLEQAVWLATFDNALSWKEFEARIAKSIQGKITWGGVRPVPKKKIKTIAISTGSGSSFLPIVSRLNADVYLTGEMGYHVGWEAEERGLNVVTVGHDASESFFAEAVVPLLRPNVKGVRWIKD